MKILKIHKYYISENLIELIEIDATTFKRIEHNYVYEFYYVNKNILYYRFALKDIKMQNIAPKYILCSYKE